MYPFDVFPDTDVDIVIAPFDDEDIIIPDPPKNAEVPLANRVNEPENPVIAVIVPDANRFKWALILPNPSISESVEMLPSVSTLDITINDPAISALPETFKLV